VREVTNNRLQRAPENLVTLESKMLALPKLSDFLLFDQYRMRRFKALEHTWHLAVLAHRYLQGLRLKVLTLPTASAA